MEYKKRTKPKELQLLEILHSRMKLTEKDKQHYLHLQKGYEGEVMFEALTRTITSDCLIINDFLLEVNNMTFQIDTVILADRFYLYEVKNFEGDYYFNEKGLYSRSNYEINNPLTQLVRSESLFRQLLQKLGLNTPIDASVVFVNPEFTLYQTPLDQPFILPSQLNRFIRNFNTKPSKITNKHIALADKLISLHLTESSYSRLPKYVYRDLRKGIVCKKCREYQIEVGWKYCICKQCGNEETVEDAVLRSVNEFTLLFPSERITTRVIYEWCLIINQKRIAKILEKNFHKIGERRWTFYK